MNRLPRAFTLIEILVAMAIFTLIGLASHAVLNSVLDSNKLSSERFKQLEALQRAMLIIERDILQTVPRSVRIEGELLPVVIRGGEDTFESEADGLGFVHEGWHNPQLLLPRSTLQAVIYRLQDGELQKVYGNYVDSVIGAEAKVRVLLNDIDDFQVQFMPASNNLKAEWQDSYMGEALPAAIAIEIDSQAFGLIRREFLLAYEVADAQT